MVRKEGVRGKDRERPYRVESWVVGARACLPWARSARCSKVGESAPVVSVTRPVTRRVTGCVHAALGVGVVVVACLTDPAGACDAAPRAISLRAPLWYADSPRLDPCACVCPCVPCVLEVTQTHIHIHTHTFTPWRVPRGGGLDGRVCPGSPRCQFTRGSC
jgi:hypothetical protein